MPRATNATRKQNTSSNTSVKGIEPFQLKTFIELVQDTFKGKEGTNLFWVIRLADKMIERAVDRALFMSSIDQDYASELTSVCKAAEGVSNTYSFILDPDLSYAKKKCYANASTTLTDAIALYLVETSKAPTTRAALARVRTLDPENADDAAIIAAGQQKFEASTAQADAMWKDIDHLQGLSYEDVSIATVLDIEPNVALRVANDFKFMFDAHHEKNGCAVESASIDNVLHKKPQLVTSEANSLTVVTALDKIIASADIIERTNTMDEPIVSSQDSQEESQSRHDYEVKNNLPHGSVGG